MAAEPSVETPAQHAGMQRALPAGYFIVYDIAVMTRGTLGSVPGAVYEGPDADIICGINVFCRLRARSVRRRDGQAQHLLAD